MRTVRCRAACAALAVASVAGCGGPAHRAASPLPAKRAVLLTGVSCTAARGCLAVGWYYTSAAGPRRTLAERWDGRGWQVQRTAAPDGALSGVSCTAPDACVAVGQPAQAWAAGRWHRAGGGGLSSVSCVSATWCQAVGNRSAARWTGRGWRPEPVTVPAGRIATLSSVSCVSARFCLAVGDAQRPPTAQPGTGRTDQALAELWDGSRWRLIRPADPAPRTALAAVSCVSARFCLAVGATDAKYTLAERWNGVRWQVQRTPDVNRIGYSVLAACPVRRACLAVGSYNVGVALVAERWNGRRWRLARRPGGAIVGPPSVSCTSAGCLVVASGPAGPLSHRLRA